MFRDFNLARMIKTYRSASCHQVLKIRERYICYMAQQVSKSLYLRDTVSERINIFYMFHYLTIVIGAYTLEIILSACYQTY